MGGEQRGGFIEHEHRRRSWPFGFWAERARDREDRTLVGRQPVDQVVHGDLQSEASRGLGAQAPCLAPAHAADRVDRVPARPEVVEHREGRNEPEVLMNEPDVDVEPARDRKRHGLASDRQLCTGLGGVIASEDLDDSALATAVVPAQRMHLAGLEREVDVDEGSGWTEVLAQVSQLQRRGQSPRRWPCRCHSTPQSFLNSVMYSVPKMSASSARLSSFIISVVTMRIGATAPSAGSSAPSRRIT